jgi:SCF-associated factor 1
MSTFFFRHFPNAMLLSNLPVDVLIQDLLPRLPYKTLIELSKTSKFFYRLCGDESLWKKLALRELHIPAYATFRNRGWKDIFAKLHHPVVYTWGEGTHYRLGHAEVVQPRGNFRK